MTADDSATPMLRQYLEIKKQYPGTILFFRLGDFYEMFNEDAIVGSRELEITLTARQKDTPNPIPMCGVPFHAAESYIAKLIRKGYRVAICEQTEAPQKGKKLVKREVVRVITPGTAVDPSMINAKEPVYLAAIAEVRQSYGLALLDTSSGEFFAAEFSGNGAWNRLRELLDSHGPRELLFPRSIEPVVSGLLSRRDSELFPFEPGPQAAGPRVTISGTPLDEHFFEAVEAERLLLQQFGVKALDAFGLKERPAAIAAAGACLKYSLETQKAVAGHICDISLLETSNFMVLDPVTQRNLDLFDSRGETKKGSLFSVIDETVTGMGARLLKSWLQRPSLKLSEISTRLDAVTELRDALLREKLRAQLRSVADIDRLVGRFNLGSANPRDVIALKNSLERSPAIRDLIIDSDSTLLQVLAENIGDHGSLLQLISSSIADDPPASAGEMGVIRKGYNAELDELRSIASGVKQAIADLERRERERTGIANLKIRFNNVFNYYIEVSRANLDKVPADYHRRQTLSNAERFTTPQLKEWEEKVLNAEERILRLEKELFDEVKSAICAESRELQRTARSIAVVDALCSLAEVAIKRNYVCPEMHDGDVIEIRKGRHPVVEAGMGESFVSNDVIMNNSTDRLLIVTGANMGGKSTVLRQTALIQILAQIGSYVPAAFARLPIVDRVWTRVGASDDLASGRSTFMVEMTETATILRNSTPRSLILLDEIGRGTSTFDGLSIAWAVAEYLHNSPDHSAKTMFATHYHELTELAELLPGAKAYQMAVLEQEDSVVFLHKLRPGRSSKSYGIAVAKLAGMPQEVIRRAGEVLKRLEQYELAVLRGSDNNRTLKTAVEKAAAQGSLFSVVNDAVLSELAGIDVESLTPDDAKSLLRDIRSRIIV
jgi:DNA mismatch repair protein MutS